MPASDNRNLIRGYSPPTDEQVRAVNRLKHLEERYLRELDALDGSALKIDADWVREARLEIKKATMSATRAVLGESRTALPEDS